MTVKVKLRHPSFFRKLDQQGVLVDLTSAGDLSFTGNTDVLQPQYIAWIRTHKKELIDDLRERDGCVSALTALIDSALVWKDLEDAIARSLDLWSTGCIPRSYVENVSLAAQQKAREIPCSWDRVKLRDLAQATGRKLMINSQLLEEVICVASDDCVQRKDGHDRVVYAATELAKIKDVPADELRSIHAAKERTRSASNPSKPVKEALDEKSSSHTRQPDAPTPSAQTLLNHLNVQTQYVTDRTEATDIVARFAREDCPLGLDLETAKLPAYSQHPQAGLDPHLSRIRLAQFYDGGETVFIFDVFALGLEPLSPLFSLPLVAHNAVFELKHLLHAGVSLGQMDCTMLAANALSGKLPSLADLVNERLGWEMSKDQQVSDWSIEELSQEQLAYAALDAVAVQKLYPLLEAELEEKCLLPVYHLMRDAQRMIAQLELNGCLFDVDGHRVLMESWEQAKKAAEEELQRELGPDVNLRSSKQLSEWLQGNLGADLVEEWPRTATGQLQTNRTTLARYPDQPLVLPLLKHKEVSKLLSTYGSSYAAHISPVTGRLHAHFRLGGTVSGRLSCRAPNVQNPPRGEDFRGLFTARVGRVLVVADYSQIELRVAALVSGDRNMLDAYAEGKDLHRLTAASVAGISFDKVTPDQRQAAKAVNFGLLFGQGAEGLARYAKTTFGVDLSVEEAQTARTAFFNNYPGIRRWQQHTSSRANRTKQVVTPGGRVRDFSIEAHGYRYTEALNTPIQGGAAEVLLAALGRLETHLVGIDALLVNIVHDELVLEVVEADADRATVAVEAAMIEGMLEIFPDASTVGLVEAHVGSNWAEAK